MPTHLQHTAIAKSHRFRKQALKVLKAFKVSRLDRTSKLEMLVKNLQRLRLRCTFISLQKLPHLVYRIADRVANRNLQKGLTQWKQADKLVKLSQNRFKNFLEDVFEAWKQRVAFKGGHSIHNRSLKAKVWMTLSKRRKAGKVKRFRSNLASDHYRQTMKRQLIYGLAYACNLQRQKRQVKTSKMQAIEIFRRDLLLRRGVAAWKKFSYRIRVHYYLSGKQRLRYGAKFLANLREKFFEARTEKMK